MTKGDCIIILACLLLFTIIWVNTNESSLNNKENIEDIIVDEVLREEVLEDIYYSKVIVKGTIDCWEQRLDDIDVNLIVMEATNDNCWRVKYLKREVK